MKVIKIEINSINETEEVVANLFLEQRKGETWNRSKVITVVSGQGENSRQLILNDDERLVVEGKTSRKVVFDAGQNAVVSNEKSALPTTPTQAVKSTGGTPPKLEEKKA